MDFSKLLITLLIAASTATVTAQSLFLTDDSGNIITFADTARTFDFDVPAHSRLLFPSDTTHMAGSFVNDTFRIEKWYDYIKRDSLVQADIALRPWFDFDDGSVRFDGGQTMFTSGFTHGQQFSVAIDFTVDTLGVGQSIITKENFTPYWNWRFDILSTNQFSFIFFSNNTPDNFYRERTVQNFVQQKQYRLISVFDNWSNIAFDDGNTIPSVTTITGTLDEIKSDADLYIGAAGRPTPVSFLTGNIRTIILFDFPLNKAQRILTNKYLQK